MDVFNINWREKMKTDPQAHSIMNNKARYIDNMYWNFRYDPTAVNNVRMTYAGRQKYKTTQFVGEPNRHTWAEKGRPFGKHIYDFQWQNLYEGDNKEKYYENMIPKRSLYNTPTIAKAPNPIIEGISYKD